MKKELQDKLFGKYPKIFRQKDLPINETCMGWGITTGNGWYNLIDTLCFHLQWNTDKNGYPQVEAIQVKEKFGGLRFYYSSIPVEGKEHSERQYGEIDGMITLIESLSNSICENCGTNKNVIQTKVWISTLCQNCLKEKK